MHTFHNELCGSVLLAVLTTATVLAVQPAKAADDNLATLVNGNNRFAVEIYTKLAQKDRNEFLSPYSLSTALAMVYAGVREGTAGQMATVLHFDLPPEKLHAAFQTLAGGLKSEGKDGDELLVANALWGQKGFEFLPEYIELVRSNYGGNLTTLDFKGSTEAARGSINNWVAKQTRGKIQNLIAPGMLNAMTRLVLTNAVYFKGTWEMPFKPTATKQENFTAAGGRKITVSTMHQQKHLGYMEEADFQALEMPYKGGRRTMVILLPRQVDGLTALEKGLDAQRLAGWLSKLNSGAEVQVSLPKFRVECQYSLAEPLTSMGMADAFSPARADFSGMDGQKDLFVSFIVHKAYVEVDEKGTEAAAATGGGMALSAAPMPHEPKVFRADHPFLFLIRDSRSGSILFLGRVMNPGAGGGAKAQ